MLLNAKIKAYWNVNQTIGFGTRMNSIDTHLRLKIPPHTEQIFYSKKVLIAFAKPYLSLTYMYILIDN